MANRPNWIPEDVDLNTASAARVYDYFLGGAHNFAVDRELANSVLDKVPDTKTMASANRAFLRRAVRYCVRQGIRQFLDIGSGIPTVGNVHEIAQQSAPESRVVYVDNEPVAVAHSESILSGNDNATVVRAELSDIDTILNDPEVTKLLDFDQPVAVMMVALLHFVPDAERPAEIIRDYYDRLAPGSYLSFSHVTADHYPDAAASIAELYAKTTNPLILRSRSEIDGLMPDFKLVDPGIVYVPEWHPDSPEDLGPDPARSIIYAAVGRKE